jgi:hypothetical protein
MKFGRSSGSWLAARGGIRIRGIRAVRTQEDEKLLTAKSTDPAPKVALRPVTPNRSVSDHGCHGSGPCKSLLRLPDCSVFDRELVLEQQDMYRI